MPWPRLRVSVKLDHSNTLCRGASLVKLPFLIPPRSWPLIQLPSRSSFCCKPVRGSAAATTLMLSATTGTAIASSFAFFCARHHGVPLTLEPSPHDVVAIEFYRCKAGWIDGPRWCGGDVLIDVASDSVSDWVNEKPRRKSQARPVPTPTPSSTCVSRKFRKSSVQSRFRRARVRVKGGRRCRHAVDRQASCTKTPAVEAPSARRLPKRKSRGSWSSRVTSLAQPAHISDAPLAFCLSSQYRHVSPDSPGKLAASPFQLPARSHPARRKTSCVPVPSPPPFQAPPSRPAEN